MFTYIFLLKDIQLKVFSLHVYPLVEPLDFVTLYKIVVKVGSVVEWLKHRTDDQHGLGSKPTCAILLCPWERHFTALSPAWWS